MSGIRPITLCFAATTERPKAKTPQKEGPPALVGKLSVPGRHNLRTEADMIKDTGEEALDALIVGAKVVKDFVMKVR